jgi:hypothetical protein
VGAKHSLALAVTVCFFVLCKRHWFNRLWSLAFVLSSRSHPSPSLFEVRPDLYKFNLKPRFQVQVFWPGGTRTERESAAHELFLTLQFAAKIV